MQIVQILFSTSFDICGHINLTLSYEVTIFMISFASNYKPIFCSTLEHGTTGFFFSLSEKVLSPDNCSLVLDVRLIYKILISPVFFPGLTL
jgi:hypothetical protein